MSSRTKWINRFAKRSAVVLAAASASAGLVNSAFAQSNGTYTFNGDGAWSNTARWVDGFVPNGQDADASFGSGTAGVAVSGNTIFVNLDSNRTVGSMSFSDSDTSTPAGWVINGTSTLRLDQSTALSGVPTITVNGLGNNTVTPGHLGQRIAQITAPLSGTEGFLKNGGGTLLLGGNSTGLSGTVTMDNGPLMLGHANAIGTASTLILRNGNLGLRTDVGATFGISKIDMRNDTVIGVGNSISANNDSSNGAYGSGANQTQTIGTITITGLGHRGLQISGSNGYGLTMGTLNILNGLTLRNQGDDNTITNTVTNDDASRHSNNVNGLGSGLVTIDRVRYTGSTAGVLDLTGTGALAGGITITNGISETGGASLSLNVSSDKTVTIGGTLGHTGSTAVRGNGTTTVSTAALTNGQALTVAGGTLQFSGSNLAHSVGNLSMGGGTIAAGNVISYLNLGSGGSLSTVGSINVSSSVLTDGTTTNTIATINGKLANGAGDKTINVQSGGDSLTVTSDVTGTGGIIKSGKGALNFTGSTNFSGTNLTIKDGMLAGTAQASGTPFGNTNVNVTAGGQIRLNGIGSAQTESINSYTASDSGQNSGIAVDGTAGGSTTLSISSWNGRVTNEKATVLVNPVSGSLGTNEHVVFGSGPVATNGILDPYWAVQTSGTDKTLSFATISGGEIGRLTSYSSSNLNTSASTDTVDSGTLVLSGGTRSAYGLRAGAGAVLDAGVNGATVQLGNGTGFGGLILNGNAALSGGTLTGNGSDEMILWSGGAGPNTISSYTKLNGDLTTAGPTSLVMTGTLDLNGTTRNVTTTGDVATLFNGTLVSNTGTLVKRGGGTLAIGGTNTGFSGNITVQNGVLQVGGSPSGDVGNAVITNNATLLFHRSDAVTFGNAISGSGDLVQDAGTSTGVLTLSGNLSYTGKTIVRSGTLRSLFESPTQTRFFPSTSDLVVERNGTFDLNGENATFATLNGTGTITNSNILAAGTPTSLTISSGSFGGSIVQTGSNNNTIKLDKVGSGELILSGNSSFRGNITVEGGSLRVDSLGATASANGAPTIVLANSATLKLNLSANQVLANPILVPLATDTATISLATVRSGEPNAAPENVSTGAGSLFGLGTLALDIAGRQLQFGPDNLAVFVAATELRNFSGTFKFLDTNPVGSRFRFRFGNGTGIDTGGAPAATFAFGSGNLSVTGSGAFAAVDMGFISGGTNTVLQGQSGVGFRTMEYRLGLLPGLQTFAGRIEDWNARGLSTTTLLSKFGTSSTLTLQGSSSFTGLAQVSAGTLILGPGSNISGTPTISVGTGGLATLAFGGGTFSSLQNFINMTSASGALNTSGVAGYSTKPLLTYLGNGTIYGNVNHNAGATNPGVIGNTGTMTFATGVTISQNGNFTFDVNPNVGQAVVLGGGTHDMIRVAATNGLRIDGGVIRLNFIGNIANLSVGQTFPLITYAGNIQGAGLSAIQAFATFPGSFNLTLGGGSLNNVIEATVANLNIPTIDLTWAPPTADISWDTVTVRNFKPTGGAGSQFFFNGDTIRFDDTVDAAHHTVILGASSLQALAVTVDTTQTYRWIGAGSFGGNGKLVKNGSGTLIMSNTAGNNFGGGITVNGGFLIADRLPASTGGGYNAWGTGTITLNNDAVLGFTAPAPNNTQSVSYGGLVVNGNNKILVPPNAGNQDWINGGNGANGNMFGTGTLSMIRAVGDTGQNYTININMISFLGTIKYPDNAITGNMRWNSGGGNTMVGGPSVTFDLGAGTTNITMRNAGSFFFGQLMGGANSSLNQQGASTMTFGQKQLDSTFGGQFFGNNAGGAFVKAGSFSTFTLTSTHGYQSPTLVNEGTLALQNGIASPIPFSNITVAQGATLDVSGLNGGAGGITVAPNQTLRSNGNVTGGVVTAGPGGTVGGTIYGGTGAIDVQTGGTLAPGNSVGTLSVGTLSLHNNSNMLIEAGSGLMDSIIVTNTNGVDFETTGDAINVNLVNLGGVVPGTYVFLDYSVDGSDDDPTTEAGGWENHFLFNADFPFNHTLTRDDINTRLILTIADNSGKWFKNNGSDVWASGSNWTTDYINTAGVVPSSVEFGTFINAAQTVTIGSSQVANNIIFNSPNSYTIAGTGTLTLDSGGVSGVSVLQGSHTIRPAVRLLHDVQVSVAASSNITFAGTIINANNAQLSKVGNGTAVFTQLNMNTGSFTVSAGTATFTQKASVNSPTGTSIVRNLSIATGAKVNLTNNDFIIDTAANPSGAQLTAVRQELQDSRLFSSLSTSTTGLGYRTNVAVASPTLLGVATATATFGGVTVDASSILIRLTLKGDTNLDGDVDIEDLYNLANNFLSTTATWLQGDFNYDGITNATDLSILATNWQQTFVGGEILSSMSLEDALTSIGGLGNPSVPEPSTLAMAGVAATGLLGRRRRRRNV